VKRNSKWIVLLLVLVMVLAACAPTSETTDPTQQPTKAPEQSDSTGSDTGEDTEPVEEELEPYELTWFMLANTITPDVELIMENLNPMLQEKINATINIVMLDWGTYQERFSTAMNAGEVIDISFTADWWRLLDYAANKFLLPLNDDNGPNGNLLQKYAPKVIEQLGEGFIVGSQVDGINYGVPTDKEFAVNAGFVWNQDLADKYGFDMSKFDENTKLEDFEPLLKTIKENEPDVVPYLIGTDGWMYTIPSTAFVSNLVVDYSVLDDTEIKFQYEMDKFVEMMKTHQRFYEQGYIARDAYTENNRANDILLEGNFFLCQQPLKPFNGKSNELMAAAGNRFKLDEVETTPLVGTSIHAAGSMLAIPTTSADPERAMMFINLMHTDPEVANLLVWGVEGTHHKVVSAGPPKIVAPIPDNNWTSAALPWTLGNVFNHWLGEQEDPRKHEGFRQTKEEAPSHITLGYRFKNTQDYQAELAAIDNALAEYSNILRTGATKDFDGDLAKLIQAAEAAGLRTVQKAVQDDLNEWLANK
jgi:putative aldouronate transport system substrate-binding protein